MTKNKGQKTGAIMENAGLIHANDIERVLAIQADARDDTDPKTSRLFGSILCDLNLLTPVENYRVLKQNKKLISLADRLVSQNLLPAGRVAQLQTRSAETGIPFLGLLLEENQVPKPVIQQLLLDLYRIPLRSISDIVFSDKKRETLSHIIPDDTAGRHQIIPLVLKEDTLLCGITDPDALVFIAELDKRYPQYRFTPVFVSFSGFSWFYKILYHKSVDSKKPEKNFEEPPLFSDVQVTIFDPFQEKEKIQTLYQGYATARQQMGHHNEQGREAQFLQFIQKQHQVVIEKYQCRAVTFFLEKQDTRIMIAAIPRTQEI